MKIIMMKENEMKSNEDIKPMKKENE